MDVEFDVTPVIAELTNSLYVVKTNEPINRKRGDIKQADLEKYNAKSFEGAINWLSRKRKPIEMMKPK
jgi:hypothetical protein